MQQWDKIRFTAKCAIEHSQADQVRRHVHPDAENAESEFGKEPHWASGQRVRRRIRKRRIFGDDFPIHSADVTLAIASVTFGNHLLTSGRII